MADEFGKKVDTGLGPVAGTVAKNSEVTKSNKLSKEVKGSILTITEGTSKKVVSYDLAKLNDSIKFNLSMHGLSQKLGDAAAGKTGEESLKSIQVVYDGLLKGDWTVRAPAGEKISKASLTEKLSNLTPKEQEVAKALLAKLGLQM